MVIDIIDVQRVAIFKAENHPPVGPHRYRPKPSQGPLERVQFETRHVQIGNAARRIKPRQNIAELHNMLGNHAARVIAFVKASPPFMANRLDQSRTVTRYVTEVKRECGSKDHLRDTAGAYSKGMSTSV